jgi:alkylhydroperoxidase family enzyme
MAHLEVLTPNAIQDPDLRAMLLASGDEMFGVYGHCPEAFKAFLQFYRPLKYGGILPFALKELVRLKIATLNACHRWQHAREPSEKAQTLYTALGAKLAGTASCTAQEHAALAFAARLAETPTALDAAFMAEMQGHFTDPELVELGLITGAFLMLGRLHLAFGVADMPAETHHVLHGPGEHEEGKR